MLNTLSALALMSIFYAKTPTSDPKNIDINCYIKPYKMDSMMAKVVTTLTEVDFSMKISPIATSGILFSF
jgi:hypothetical protein